MPLVLLSPVASASTVGAATQPAPCSPECAARMIELLARDYLTLQVFLDLGRLFRPGRARSGLHEQFLLADLERHTRFLSASLERIAAAFAEAGGRGALF